MKHVSAILLAAGKGLRFKSKVPKPLARIHSKPVILYSLDILSRHPSIEDIIVVANDGNTQQIVDLIRQEGIKKIRRIVRGGGRRQDSVSHALVARTRRTAGLAPHLS